MCVFKRLHSCWFIFHICVHVQNFMYCHDFLLLLVYKSITLDHVWDVWEISGLYCMFMICDWFRLIFICVVIQTTHVLWWVPFELCLQIDHVGPFLRFVRLLEILVDLQRFLIDSNWCSYIVQLSKRNGCCWFSFKLALQIDHFVPCKMFVLFVRILRILYHCWLTFIDFHWFH